MEKENIYDEEQERIHREVVILDDTDNDPDEGTYYTDEELEEAAAVDEDAAEDEEFTFADTNAKHTGEADNSTWTLITTGRILTEGALPYYRYFIAIAVMCFVSIFLTFAALNANREYRQREQYAWILHERAVLKEEIRYGLSSKSSVTKRLESHGVHLVDLSKQSRLIEK
jgi:hypothetical protein